MLRISIYAGIPWVSAVLLLCLCCASAVLLLVFCRRPSAQLRKSSRSTAETEAITAAKTTFSTLERLKSLPPSYQFVRYKQDHSEQTFGPRHRVPALPLATACKR